MNKDILTINEVQTVADLILAFTRPNDYSVAYVTELNAFAIAVPESHCQGNYMGKSSVTFGATTIQYVEMGPSGDDDTFSVYKADENIVKLVVAGGGTFDFFGSNYEFDFANKTVSSSYFSSGDEHDEERTGGQVREASEAYDILNNTFDASIPCHQMSYEDYETENVEADTLKGLVNELASELDDAISFMETMEDFEDASGKERRESKIALLDKTKAYLESLGE